MTRRLLLALAAGAALAVTSSVLAGEGGAADAAAAGDATGPDMPPVLESYLEDVQTLTADFTQTLVDADGTTLEESSGSVRITRPGRFQWIYREPYEQWLVADGLNLWSYDVDLEQVTVKAQAEALASTPALLLGGSDDVLAGFRSEGSADRGGLTWARLVPLDADSGFRHVELGFSDGQLTRMVFLDDLEQTTLVDLANVVVNEPIPDDTYDFVVPDEVDVVGTPAPRSGARP